MLFAIFALFHAVRLLKHIQVTLEHFQVPFGLSWFAFVAAAALAVWMWRLSTK